MFFEGTKYGISLSLLFLPHSSSLFCLVLQEVLPSPGGPAGLESVQAPGSTINLQDLQ